MVNHGPHIEAKKQDSLIAVMAVSGGTAFVLSIISPTLTYLILCGVGYRLITSYDYWHTLTLPRPANFTQHDNTGKAIMVGIALAGLLLFYQFSLFSQMILAALASAALSGIFINNFVLYSQNALNRALKVAATQSEPHTTNNLLRRGADPFFQDNTGNIAFHDAVQNNPNAIRVLQNLNNYAPRQYPELLSILEPPHDWRMNERAGQFYTALINCRDFTERNRGLLWEATENLLEQCYAYLANITNAFVLYYRNEISYPKNINSRNNAGHTPAQFLDILHIDEPRRLEMRQWFEAQGDPMPAPPAPPVPPAGPRGVVVPPRAGVRGEVVPPRAGARIEEVPEGGEEEKKRNRLGT